MRVYVGTYYDTIEIEVGLLRKHGLRLKRMINLSYGVDRDEHIVYWGEVDLYGIGESKFFAIEDLIEMVVIYWKMLLTLSKRHDHIDILEGALEWNGDMR